MNKKIENILIKFLQVLFISVLAYLVLGSVYFRFSNPSNTDLEIMYEVFTFGNYEREYK